MAVYFKFVHDLPKLESPTEYLGPFDSPEAAVQHGERWGGLHGERVDLEEPPTDGIIYSPEEHMEYQKGRE